MNSRYFALKGVSVLFLALIAFISSCRGGHSSDGYSGLEYPSEIRITDPITIRVSDSLSFKGVEDKFSKTISVSPKFDYNIEVLNSNTISIKAITPLPYKTVYTVSIDMGRLFSGAAGDGVKSFEVRTIPPIFKCSEEKLTTYSDIDDAYYIKGEVETSDFVDYKAIEQGMKVEGGDFIVKWTHSQDGCLHSFTIENIYARESSFNIKVIRDYSKYDDRGVNEVSYFIPAKGKYMVVSEEIVSEPYHFEISFSSEINKKQPFRDLISVPGGGRLKFVIDKNKLSIFPDVRAKKTQSITINKNLKNIKGDTLEEDWTAKFSIPSTSPSVKFITRGSILPSSNDMIIHFQSVNYAKAQVRVRRIYESNVLQYFQDAYLNTTSAYNLNNVSRVIADTTFALDAAGSQRLRNLSSYGIDLSKIIKPEKGDIYKVEIRGREKLSEDESDGWESDYYFGNYEDYKYRSVNILVSDLGVVAKGSDMNVYTFFVHNLIDAKPVSGAKISIYNSVNQLIGESVSDGEGMASIALDDKPLTAVITSYSDKTYIKMDNGLSLSLSNFDVEGAPVKNGQKGFIFGERGVWRPGDDIFITFISMLSEGVLPSGHPVTATLLNPQSQVVQTLTNNSGSNGMYAFKFKTDPSSPTGNWQVEVSAGGQTYSKIIKIETIKPNKLLIDLSFGSESVIRSSDISGKMKVNWLTGGAGRNLESRVEVTLSRTNTSFANYKNYIFEDISRNFHSETREIAVGKTDESGKYTFISSIANSGAVPGFLKGVFTTRVFESGGDFSIDNFSTIISPYNTYIGIDVPEQENDWGGKYLNIENEHLVKIVALNPYGSPSSIRNVEVEIYKMGWNWWWGSSSGELASYSRDSYNRPYKVFSTSLKDGAGSFALNLSDQEGGFYFIRVMDPIGGHAASKVVLISNSYSLEGTGEGEGAARLKTSIDKEKYNVGETANLSIPSAPGAIAIVSLEKGEKVIKTFNRECKGSTTVISIPIDGTMAPNIYASVTLIQPHNVSSNDAPIRLFGVQKICVEDPKSHLYPEIIVKDEIRPESEVTISVKERDGRAMSYVLEVVDEGLLSLTRFKTPQPWDVFYATEALGVRTWDLYDMVIGAYGAKMERLFAIGGDGEEAVVPSKSKAERFKPVSIFLGPFTLKGNGSDVHKITIPQYIGSLRVMVVSTDGKAQGSAQKNVTVKKPLMVQTTMPRVVRVNEKISVPVTVFAMAENMGEVTVKIDVNEAFKVAGADSKTIVMNKSGEEIVYFDVEAASDQQLGEIIASAKCGSEGAKEKIEIDITEPNSPATVSKTILLKGGESSKIDFALAGKKGTNTMQVEASVLPPIDLDYRLKYVISYPYGCLEQTVSAAFPQLYLSDLADLSSQESLESENNIKNALSRLHIFAHPSGGFTYWPGDGAGVSFWSTVYAAHFMIEASGKGYAVPSQLLGKALEYIRERGTRNDDSTLERAYSFYVLALSGNAPRGAMNRLREVSGLSNSDKWFLAAAYAADNKKDISKDIVSEMVSSGSPKTVNRFALSFDSKERELATAIMVYNALGEYENAFKVVRTLSLFLNDREHYMSTQSTAWALNAIAGYSKTQRGGKIDITLTSSGKHFDIKGDDSYIRKELFNSAESSLSGAIPIEVKNNSSSETSIVISSRGVPSQGEELSSSHGLKVNLKYSTISGGYLDPYNIALGTDFLIETTVTNTSNSIDYTNLMLSQIFPSGWEYKRERTDSYYQDLRDDRIYTSFDLPKYTSITFKVRATATFRGHFYLPATTCEAMYDSSVNGSTSGGWIDIK